MVIKGSAAKRDGERLHPVADVEQGGKKEKEESVGRGWVCGGKDGGEKKKDSRERARRKTGEQRER